MYYKITDIVESFLNLFRRTGEMKVVFFDGTEARFKVRGKVTRKDLGKVEDFINNLIVDKETKK